MKRVLKVLFWMHLVAGLAVGLIIFFLSLTGTLLAFGPQLRELAQNQSVTNGAPLAFNELFTKLPEKTSSLEVVKDHPSVVFVQLGRKTKLRIDRADGHIIDNGEGRVAAFLETAENLHRWFQFSNEGDHKTAKLVKGISMGFFLFLIISGLVLWWPAGVKVFNFKLKKKARQWNQHNVIGFWSSTVLFVIALTGLLMVFWTLPPKKFTAPPTELATFDFDRSIALAQEKYPEWTKLTFRFPKTPADFITLTVEETVFAGLKIRTQFLPVEEAPGTAARLRGWMKPLHTGEAAAWPGQVVAFLASLGALFLVWSGFYLSYRRFFSKIKKDDL